MPFEVENHQNRYTAEGQQTLFRTTPEEQKASSSWTQDCCEILAECCKAFSSPATPKPADEKDKQARKVEPVSPHNVRFYVVDGIVLRSEESASNV